MVLGGVVGTMNGGKGSMVGFGTQTVSIGAGF